MENVQQKQQQQQVKVIEPVSGSAYPKHGYGYTASTHHYHKNAPKVTATTTESFRRCNYEFQQQKHFHVSMLQSNSDRMMATALSIGGKQQSKTTSSHSGTGSVSPKVQVVDVRWPMYAYESNNGNQGPERTFSRGRPFHLQADQGQPVLVSVSCPSLADRWCKNIIMILITMCSFAVQYDATPKISATICHPIASRNGTRSTESSR